MDLDHAEPTRNYSNVLYHKFDVAGMGDLSHVYSLPAFSSTIQAFLRVIDVLLPVKIWVLNAHCSSVT